MNIVGTLKTHFQFTSRAHQLVKSSQNKARKGPRASLILSLTWKCLPMYSFVWCQIRLNDPKIHNLTLCSLYKKQLKFLKIWIQIWETKCQRVNEFSSSKSSFLMDFAFGLDSCHVFMVLVIKMHNLWMIFNLCQSFYFIPFIKLKIKQNKHNRVQWLSK